MDAKRLTETLNARLKFGQYGCLKSRAGAFMVVDMYYKNYEVKENLNVEFKQCNIFIFF